MQDEHERPPSLPTDARDGHGPAVRHHRASARARHDETIRCLEALRSAHDIPRFGTWMTVAGTVAVGLGPAQGKAPPYSGRCRACRLRPRGGPISATLLRPLRAPLSFGNRVKPIDGRRPPRRLLDLLEPLLRASDLYRRCASTAVGRAGLPSRASAVRNSPLASGARGGTAPACPSAPGHHSAEPGSS